MKTVETKLPVGEIVKIEKLSDGTGVVMQKVAEVNEEKVSKVCENEDLFVRIEASKLSLQDKFMQYEPQTKREKEFKALLTEVIRGGVKDFYRPRIDPCFDCDSEICFIAGNEPAVGKSYDWWEEIAKRFNPNRKSRLGTKSEYVAFLGVLLKKLIEEGWSKGKAWNAVCNDSKKLGHYWNSENAKHDFETTGSREICGFFDLANAYKILAEDIDAGGFWLAGGVCNFDCIGYPLAGLGHCFERYCNLNDSVGWLVLE